MKMKKRIVLALCLVLVVLVTACGDSAETVKHGKKRGSDPTQKKNENKEKDKDKMTPTPTPEELISLTLWSTAVQGDLYYSAYDRALREMKSRYPHICVTMAITPDTDDYKQKLKSSMESGSTADIFLTWSCSFLEDFVREDKVYCLDDMYQNYKDMLPEKMCRNFTFDGKKYGIPLNMSVVTLFANMEVLRSVGYTVVPTDKSQFFELCEKLVAHGITPFGCAGRDVETWCVMEYLEPIMVKTVGASTMDAILQGKASWDNEDIAWAMAHFLTFLNSGFFDAADKNRSNDEVKERFMAGEYAFYQNGSWNCADFARCGVNIQACELPVFSNKSTRGQLVGGPNEALAVSANSKNPEIAAQYAFEFAHLINTYVYLESAVIPSWKIDVDDSDVNYLTRQVYDMVVNSDYLVLYGDNLLKGKVLEFYFREVGKAFTGEIQDGETFKQDMKRASW